jgi:cytochrome P450
MAHCRSHGYVPCVNLLKKVTDRTLGVPHVTTRDEEYRGYFIPKGTLILGSIWNILHNPEDYPDPEVFKPERYLTPEGKFNTSVRDPRTAAFGFGRRICPGRHAADASLFATVSTILATVHIERAKDAEGKEIIPEVDQTSGILSQPKAFEWSAKPRSKRAEALLAAALS